MYRHVGRYIYLISTDEKNTILNISVAVFGGLLSLLLPETLGSRLPEDLDDIEDLRKNSKSMFTCVKPSRDVS